jgi:hypothetical protein
VVACRSREPYRLRRLGLLTAQLLLMGLLGGCASAPRDSGWITLLDGARPESLGNWARQGADHWRIQDGAVVDDQGAGGFLVSKQSFSDVEIRAEVWVTSDTNSGVFFRCSEPSAVSVHTCYEMNIWDDYKVRYYATGAIALFAKVDPVPKAGGKWSTFDIVARGTHLRVMMDGKQTVEIDDTTHGRGPIALQYGGNGGIVKWRTVQVRPLSN